MNKQRNENKDQDDLFNLFNLNDFKKWMHNQHDAEESHPDIVGLHIETKVSVKKLVSRMEVVDGDDEELAKEFKHNGGVISEVDGHKLLVEVDSGSFIIHKMYVKKSS
jgi:hypothetical protein